jgi:hypothetical protein
MGLISKIKNKNRNQIKTTQNKIRYRKMKLLWGCARQVCSSVVVQRRRTENRSPHNYRTAHLPSTPPQQLHFSVSDFVLCCFYLIPVFVLFLLITPVCRDLYTTCARMLIVRS